jgi:hypothetical protein
MTIGRVAGKSDDTHGGKLDSETITRKQGKAGTDTERRRERERERKEGERVQVGPIRGGLPCHQCSTTSLDPPSLLPFPKSVESQRAVSWGPMHVQRDP